LVIVKVTPEFVEQTIRDPDWARLDAQTDAEIAFNVARGPDAPPSIGHAPMAAGVVRVIAREPEVVARALLA
jgi:hypothetical protein